MLTEVESVDHNRQPNKSTIMVFFVLRSEEFWESTVPKFDDADWLKHFRMRKADFDSLVAMLWNDMKPGIFQHT